MFQDSQQFLSVEAAAKRLGVSRISVYRWTESGVLPSVKLGARRLIPIACIDELVAKATEKQGA